MGEESFTEEARTALNLAGQEALALYHNYVGTEHLLLGLAAEGGAAARVLQEFGVTLEQLRSALAVITPPEQTSASSARFTPRAERVLGLAQDEANRLGASEANALHLLLGLIREGQGIAVGVLSKAMGLDLEDVRIRALRALNADEEPCWA